MRYKWLILVMLLFSQGKAQEKKHVRAVRISSTIKIDGVLDEAAYENVLPATDFMQLQPHNGAPSFQTSKVKFVYDDGALYVGAMLYDEKPDSIFNLLTERDHIGRSDYFGVYLDPNNEGLTSYGFFVTPAGVQIDMKAIKRGYDSEEDSWDAVWESATQITKNGWVVEMRIPYAALRFPKQDVHTWGLNMFRQIRRYNSNNSWNRVNNTISGFIQQQGELRGIENIKPPLRLSLTPYASAYRQNNTNSGYSNVYKGGMDLKLGISESFTLDMMLIPDFGQVQSDDVELNLSPYELYYDERRQFFTEGMELFQRANIFYSRRIGGRPTFSNAPDDHLNQNDSISFNPITTDIINATKVSGRTKNGLGIGFLNAITAKAQAEITDTITGQKRKETTQPFTNYNVSVIEKSMKNNSYISVINTNMSMHSSAWIANVTGTEFKFITKDAKYTLEGTSALSYKYDEKSETGYSYDIRAKKSSGNLMYGIGQDLKSDTFDPNDMGYLRRNNEINTYAYANYNLYDPKGIYNEWYNHVSVEYIRMYNPSDVYGSEVDISSFMVFKNYMDAGIFMELSSEKNDYYETRTDGRYLIKPAKIEGGIRYGTDSRKKLDFDMRLLAYNYPQTDRNGYQTWAELELRVGQKLNMEFDVRHNGENNNIGYVDKNEAEDSIYMGKRDIFSTETELELKYVFNNKMALSFRGRHYWSGAQYSSYYLLNLDGTLNPNTGYDDENDISFNAFNIDMVFRWVFAPGSELSIAWKNTIYDDRNKFESNYLENLNRTFSAVQSNSISVKVLYYIDFNRVLKSMSKQSKS